MKRVKHGKDEAIKFAEKERIVMFLSYCLTDYKNQDGNSEL